MNSFQPLPWLSNPHLQTILGNWLTGLKSSLPSLQRLVQLPDGDQIVLHETTPLPTNQDPPVVLLVHGLGGSSRSSHLIRMTRRLAELGWRVFRMDLRGAGAGVRRARRFYSSACWRDIGAVVDDLARSSPGSALAVIGFSLGGNIVLNYAGEIGTDAPPSLRAVAAMAPPIDLPLCSKLIERYPFYDAFFVHNLTQQVRLHQRYFPELPRMVFPRRLTLRQFDDRYTAPRWGYPSALEYYRDASAFARIDGIRLPTFILTARDDPFVAVAPFERLPSMPHVEVHITAHGGHLGFLGRDESGGIRWAEMQIVQWLSKQLTP